MCTQILENSQMPLLKRIEAKGNMDGGNGETQICMAEDHISKYIPIWASWMEYESSCRDGATN